MFSASQSVTQAFVTHTAGIRPRQRLPMMKVAARPRVSATTMTLERDKSPISRKFEIQEIPQEDLSLKIPVKA